ncbi:MAG: GTP-binding protein [Candidatus Lokiarchaeota archaeon]|nr:GTP-binding protein [Candidatus Lokiarchaeota archaeon]
MKKIAIQEKTITYSFKIVIVGGPAVGKTCLFNRFCFNSFNFDTSMTIGINFHSINLPIYNTENSDDQGEKLASNSIFDFGGQERFRPLIPKFLKGADGALMVFNLISPESFKYLDFWYDQLIQQVKGSSIPKILVGSKKDLIETTPKENLVDETLIQTFLKEKNITSYYKTSALENYNVINVFKELNNLMLKNNQTKYLVS